MAKQPIVLTSLEDLEIPEGLFPDMEALFIRRLAMRVLSILGGSDIDEINEQFALFNDIRDKAFTSEDFLEQPEIKALKSLLINRLESSWSVPFSIPETVVDTDELGLYSLIKALNTNPSDLWPKVDGTSGLLKQLSPSIKLNDKFVGCVALYSYMLAISHAKDLKENDTNKDPYYRLGKINKYLYPIHFVLSLSSQIWAELSAYQAKEDDVRKKQAIEGRKGSLKSHEKSNAIKRKLINSYIKALESDPALKKAPFVRDFVEELDSTEVKEFSPTNIHRNLRDTLTDYEKGRIPPHIWPG